MDNWDREPAYYHEVEDDWWSENDAWWNDGYYVDDGGHGQDAWWNDEWWNYDGETSLRRSTTQPSKVLTAESLALEANRTWAEAQRATQALRRDRGFGAVVSKGSGKCLNCGGNHFARDCPDRRHPGFGKGKGKACAAEMEEMEDMCNYFIGQGKGMSKGKGKKGPWMQAHAAWTKGKGKYRAKGKDREL